MEKQENMALNDNRDLEKAQKTQHDTIKQKQVSKKIVMPRQENWEK